MFYNLNPFAVGFGSSGGFIVTMWMLFGSDGRP